MQPLENFGIGDGIPDPPKMTEGPTTPTEALEVPTTIPIQLMEELAARGFDEDSLHSSDFSEDVDEVDQAAKKV